MTITERNKLSQLIDISDSSYGTINKADIKGQKAQLDDKMLRLFRNAFCYFTFLTMFQKFKFENQRLIPYAFVYLWMKCVPTSVSMFSNASLDSWINYFWFDNLHSNDPYLILPIIHASLLYYIVKNYEKTKVFKKLHFFIILENEFIFQLPFLETLLELFSSFSLFYIIFFKCNHSSLIYYCFQANEIAFIICIVVNKFTSTILKYTKISNKLNLKCENTFNLTGN